MTFLSGIDMARLICGIVNNIKFILLYCSLIVYMFDISNLKMLNYTTSSWLMRFLCIHMCINQNYIINNLVSFILT